MVQKKVKKVKAKKSLKIVLKEIEKSVGAGVECSYEKEGMLFVVKGLSENDGKILIANAYSDGLKGTLWDNKRCCVVIPTASYYP